MHRKEINERSPVRVLEASIHGGLGRGNIGVVVARHGVGKTAFLVGVAMDDLMRGRKVLHISLEHPIDKVRSYYDEIFMDLTHGREMEGVWKVRLDLERNRHIHCYLGGTFTVDKLRDAVGFLREHGDFQPAAVIVDDYDFTKAGTEDIGRLRKIARELDAELWMSAVTHRESKINEHGVPEPVAHVEKDVDVILGMAHDTKAVHVSILKDHDNPEVSDLKLALDPTTMLLIRER
jgi:hypothetical protein